MKQPTFRPGRRRFLRASSALGLAGTAPLLVGSCGGGSNDDAGRTPANGTPPPTGEGRERRTLHFDLSHAAMVEPRLQVHRSAHHRALLTAHTAASRTLARAADPGLGPVPDAALTHYVVDVDLPADALQTVWVMGRHPTTDEPVLGGAFIAVPRSAQAMVRQRALAAGRAGGVPKVPLDPHIRPVDAATLLVFHHPDLMNLKPDLGGDILQRIQQLPCTDAGGGCLPYLSTLSEQIALRIGMHGYPSTTPGSWCTLIPMTDADGRPSIDAQGQPRYRFELQEDIAAVVGEVARNILLDVFDDPLFEGTNWHDTEGLANVDVPARTAIAAAAAEVFDVAASQPVGSSFDGIRVVDLRVSDPAERIVEMTVKNDYLRFLSIYVQYLDGQQKPLPVLAPDTTDTERAKFVRMLLANNQLMGIPFQGNDVPSNKFSFKMPAAAASAVVMFGGAGVGGDAFAPEAVTGSCLTLALNIGLPTLLLAEGVYANVSVGLKAIFEDKELIEKLLTGFLKLIAKSTPKFATGIYGGLSSDSCKPMFLAFAPLALSMLLSSMPALVKLLATAVTVEEMLEAVPFVGIAVRVLATLADLAAIAVSVGEVCASAAISKNTVSLKMASTVRVSRDIRDFQFPASARRYVVEAVYDGGAIPLRAEGTMDAGTAGPIDVVLPQVASGGQVVVTVSMYSATDCLVGYVKSQPIVNLPATAGLIALSIVETLAPLNAQTQYRHAQILGHVAGRRSWQAGPAPTQTAASLCAGADGAICSLDGITVHTPTGMVGYGYFAGGQPLPPCGGATGTGALHVIQNESVAADPDGAFKLSPCGGTQPLGIVYDAQGPAVGGHHFFVQPGADGFHLKTVDLAADAPFDFDQPLAWGRFKFAQDSLAVLPSGYVVGVNRRTHKMEVLTLPTAPVDSARAPDAVRFAHMRCGRGRQHGRLDTPVAVATSRGAVLVLEQGNARIQALNPSGHSVRLFAGKTTSIVRLRAETGVTYLDLAVEGAGYMYVLSHVGQGGGVSDYRLDVYTPDGAFLNRTTGLAAARITVDMFRVLYTLNYAPIPGSPRVEPSLSKWNPSADATCAKTPSFAVSDIAAHRECGSMSPV